MTINADVDIDLAIEQLGLNNNEYVLNKTTHSIANGTMTAEIQMHSLLMNR